jgi:hypothetical protein
MIRIKGITDEGVLCLGNEEERIDFEHARVSHELEVYSGTFCKGAREDFQAGLLVPVVGFFSTRNVHSAASHGERCLVTDSLYMNDVSSYDEAKEEVGKDGARTNTYRTTPPSSCQLGFWFALGHLSESNTI